MNKEQKGFAEMTQEEVYEMLNKDPMQVSEYIANLIPENPTYNKPSHYHQHAIDTIQFLQEGFPPDVFIGFAIGHIIKYIQRYQYKNGVEDLEKAFDYTKRLLDFHYKKKLGI
jgi:hypothetical protein